MAVSGDLRKPAQIHDQKRRDDIQGLRAVAVLLVVFYHSGAALRGGFVGVDVFFVISGYVITRMLLAELDRSDRIDLKRFYLRRVRRILPALAVLLSVVLLAAVLLAPFGGRQITAGTGAGAALFSANIYLLRFGGQGGYFDIDAETNALLHTWSLSVEEQFYFVFPALLLAAWFVGRRVSKKGSRKFVVGALIVAAVASFVASLLFTYGYLGPLGAVDAVSDLHQEFSFYSPLTRAWEFAAGALLALVTVSAVVARSTSLNRALAIAGIALITWAALFLDEFTPFPGFAALVPVVGTMLLIAAGEPAGLNPVSALLSTKPLLWIGNLSYSWYLWHWPLIVFSAALWPGKIGIQMVAAVLSLLPAWASFKLVENPVRFRPQASPLATMRLAAICIAVPLAAAGVLQGTQRAVTSSDAVAAFTQANEQHADLARGCDSVESARSRPKACAWIVDASVGTAMLIGDSNAGHFTEGFVHGANSVGLNATVATSSGCPFVDLVLIRNGVTHEPCRGFVVASIADIAQMEISHLVIASASDRYIERDEFVLQDPVTGELFVTADEKAAAWSDGLRRVIESVSQQDRSVTVLHPMPKFEGWDPRNYAAILWMLDAGSLGQSVPIETVNEQRRRAVESEARAVSASQASAADLSGDLCSPQECDTNPAGVWLWRDGNHISVAASLMLSDHFSSLLGG